MGKRKLGNAIEGAAKWWHEVLCVRSEGWKPASHPESARVWTGETIFFQMKNRSEAY